MKAATRSRNGDAATDDAERWAAVQRRDRSSAGSFFFAVDTTGVYCRPGCPARLPKRENTRFFETGEEAQRSGFRACKRCKPEQASTEDRGVEIVREVCREIEGSLVMPRLSNLAHGVGLSPYYLHRLFKKVTGVTPRAYADEQRLRRVKQSLRSQGSVTEAIYDAGYQASSRFYEKSRALLGMTPREYRGGGAGRRIRHRIVPCSLGMLLVAATDDGICAVRFGDGAQGLERELRKDYPRAKLLKGDSRFDSWVDSVVDLIERGFPQTPGLPLDIQGTAFQRRVWEELLRISAGETAGYGDIAERIGDRNAARAVARACASNPLAVLIPCHRVVRKDGSLGGYRWGVERKKKLLQREQGPRKDKGPTKDQERTMPGLSQDWDRTRRRK